MNREQYINAISSKLADDNRITCEECGRKDAQGHAIIDHQAKTVRMVCSRCWQKYDQLPRRSGKDAAR